MCKELKILKKGTSVARNMEEGNATPWADGCVLKNIYSINDTSSLLPHNYGIDQVLLIPEDGQSAVCRRKTVGASQRY